MVTGGEQGWMLHLNLINHLLKGPYSQRSVNWSVIIKEKGSVFKIVERKVCRKKISSCNVTCTFLNLDSWLKSYWTLVLVLCCQIYFECVLEILTSLSSVFQSVCSAAS